MKGLPNLKVALILHDEDDIETRKQERIDFKKGAIDILIVFNMLLTGFDAPRLKRLYVGRVIKEHNLLQALTRVNRPYGQHRFGTVIDFADIRKEFDKTNQEYMRELQEELGDAFSEYDSIFMTEDEISVALTDIEDVLFLYDRDNISVFTQQISNNVNKPELLRLQKALTQYREMANIARLYGYDALASSFTVDNASAMLTEVTNRIKLLNQREMLDQATDMLSVLNIAMDQIQFVFKRISKDEMVIADSYREKLECTRHTMHSNHDPDDPEYVTLLEELQRLLQKKKIEELTAEEMRENMNALDRIRAQAAELNRRDAMLTQRYENDPRFMRIHKRLKANPQPIGSDVQIHQVLMRLKHSTDESVMMNSGILRNEAYFTQSLMPQIINALRTSHLTFTLPQVQFLGQTISREYFRERIWAN